MMLRKRLTTVNYSHKGRWFCYYSFRLLKAGRDRSEIWTQDRFTSCSLIEMLAGKGTEKDITDLVFQISSPKRCYCISGTWNSTWNCLSSRAGYSPRRDGVDGHPKRSGWRSLCGVTSPNLARGVTVPLLSFCWASELILVNLDGTTAHLCRG